MLCIQSKNWKKWILKMSSTPKNHTSAENAENEQING